MRKRPNYYPNRYNQWVVAGKIAVQTGAINPYLPGNHTIVSIYRTNSGKVHYSVIGQDYLHKLGIEIKEL